jgi:hypothetical protein
MVGTPTSRRAVYYFADYEESEYQGRQRITRQHVTVPETVPTLVKIVLLATVLKLFIRGPLCMSKLLQFLPDKIMILIELPNYVVFPFL